MESTNNLIYENQFEAYPEEVLIACQNGKPCDYGICDECPNVIGFNRSDSDE